MHQDLLDAVNFLVARGVVDQKQVAIMGILLLIALKLIK